MNDPPADLEHIEDLRQMDPEKARKLAETAVIRASRGSDIRQLVEAMCVLGGVQRTLGLWDEAEDLFLEAALLLKKTGSRGVDCLGWFRQMAVLRRDQRRFEEARSYAERSVEICREQRDPRLGWALTILAITHADERNLSAAAKHAREALNGLNPGDRCYRSAVMTLVVALCESADSELEEISCWLDKARRPDPPGSYAATQWMALEGLVDRRVGSFEESEAKLWTAFREFCRLSVGLDAAVCCLHLALLYLESGRPKDAKRLSGELFPVFHMLRLNREATSALMIFRRAAEQDRLTVELVRDLKARIEAIPTPPCIPRKT